MIIGLAGFKGSGKDTVAAYLVKEHDFERKAFADPLKQSVAALFNVPFSDVDQYKNDAGIFVELKAAGHLQDRRYTFREFLQRYGTESHRDVFGYDFWLDYTLPVQGYYPGRKIVVSDVRFQNEADRITHLGGVVWFVDRPETDNKDEHISESVEFEADYTVHNDGTIEDLYERIELTLSLAPVT